ncbi:tetratricopeptide repeat protein [Maribacter sp. MAR_2009_72]|uniref:tetratricopeptide repeat protein n=1 Tax=Maribacter sp. MAR_2009_72 TaxID=1250050 RepID=UPI00119C677E|nr:hypothetical protein [Maribacter sp. MAR_2009_72]TVZ15593.1 hypothetical protein JM81_1839 [Maribacter sp. MAR_2009_72]
MFTPVVRIILVITSIGLAIVFYGRNDFWNMALSLFGAVLFVYGYFKYGTVYAAFQQLKKENYDKAEKLISKIKNPEQLSKSQKGYFHFTNGIIASEKEEWDYSLSELLKALKIGLRTENDKSIVLLNLANVEFEKKNYDKATEYIKEVRKIDLKPLVKSETDTIEQKINVAQQNL